ncbi:uncharacterized protein RJT20DRAFT_37913 [Scheffersomyces xylosifermentans]|uniref:uncharacterized protein n=1 Tax=Scheffersomyces xylosifermentans TaxID=1304137 RepID=UPI00315D0A4E
MPSSDSVSLDNRPVSNQSFSAFSGAFANVPTAVVLPMSNHYNNNSHNNSHFPQLIPGQDVYGGMAHGQMPLPLSSPSKRRTPAVPVVAAVSPPMKKKRGRPPKASSLTNKITTTLNINVNTSPLSSSPTAESNSNQIVKRGAPDFFTPLMRVSPTSRTKRKRKNSSSSSLGSSPTLTKKNKSSASFSSGLGKNMNHNQSQMTNMLVTPLSTAINGSTFTPYHQINAKTLDNISMITSDHSNIHSTNSSSPMLGGNMHSLASGGPVPYYNTPPSSTVKNQFPNYLNTPNFDSSKIDFATPSQDESNQRNSIIVNQAYLNGTPTPLGDRQDSRNSDQQVSPTNDNLLPPVSLHSSGNNSTGKNVYSNGSPYRNTSTSSSGSSVSLHSSTTTLSANNSRKSTLANVKEEEDHDVSAATSLNSTVGNSRITKDFSLSSSSSNDFSLKLTIDDSGKAVLSDFFNMDQKPTDTNTSTIEEAKVSESAATAVNSSVSAPEPEIGSQFLNRKAQTPPPVLKSRLTHVNSVIGIEAQYMSGSLSPALAVENTEEQSSAMQNRPNLLRRHNSDFTGVAASSILTQQSNPMASINENYYSGNSQLQVPSNGVQLPQTPNYKENYLYSNTGLTPNSNLTFNLTPQFNSMMYSMMNINSPQQKKGLHNSQQFFMNQEFFMNGGASNDGSAMMDQSGNSTQQSFNSQDYAQDQMQQELMEQQSQQQQDQQHQQQQASVNVTDLMSSQQEKEIAVEIKPTSDSIPSSVSSESVSNSEDSGDARLALRKIIHVKRR